MLGHQLVDFRGKPMPIQFDRCITGPTLAPKAIKLFGSPKEAFTTDNQINAAFGVQPILEDQVTSTTAFWGQKSTAHGLTSLWGMTPLTQSYVKPDNRSAVYFIEMDFVVGVDFFEGIAGTAGA